MAPRRVAFSSSVDVRTFNTDGIRAEEDDSSSSDGSSDSDSECDEGSSSSSSIEIVDVIDLTGNDSHAHLPSEPVDGLPIGWTVRHVPRSSGSGKYSYYYSPHQHKFKSKIEAKRFIACVEGDEANGDESIAYGIFRHGKANKTIITKKKGTVASEKSKKGGSSVLEIEYATATHHAASENIRKKKKGGSNVLEVEYADNHHRSDTAMVASSDDNYEDDEEDGDNNNTQHNGRKKDESTQSGDVERQLNRDATDPLNPDPSNLGSTPQLTGRTTRGNFAPLNVFGICSSSNTDENDAEEESITASSSLGKRFSQLASPPLGPNNNKMGQLFGDTAESLTKILCNLEIDSALTGNHWRGLNNIAVNLTSMARQLQRHEEESHATSSSDDIGNGRGSLDTTTSSELDRMFGTATDESEWRCECCLGEYPKESVNCQSCKCPKKKRGCDVKTPRDYGGYEEATTISSSPSNSKTGDGITKDNDNNSSAKASPPTPETPRTLSETGWGNYFQLRSGEWRCTVCWVVNPKGSSDCLCCVSLDNLTGDDESSNSVAEEEEEEEATTTEEQLAIVTQERDMALTQLEELRVENNELREEIRHQEESLADQDDQIMSFVLQKNKQTILSALDGGNISSSGRSEKGALKSLDDDNTESGRLDMEESTSSACRDNDERLMALKPKGMDMPNMSNANSEFRKALGNISNRNLSVSLKQPTVKLPMLLSSKGTPAPSKTSGLGGGRRRSGKKERSVNKFSIFEDEDSTDIALRKKPFELKTTGHETTIR